MDDWRTVYYSATSTGLGTKNFSVPTDRMYWIKSVVATYISGATVGNRNLFITALLDDSDDQVAMSARAGAVQAENLTRYYQFAPDVERMTSFGDTDWLTIPIPDVPLLPGSLIEVAANTRKSDDDIEIKVLLGIRPTKGRFWNVP